MKKLLCFIIIVVSIICLWQKDLITKFISQKIIYKDTVLVENANEYYKNSDFLLIKNTDKFIVKDKSQFLDIIYTTLNNGWQDFNFFCDYTYNSCINDLYDIIENTDYIQAINNYVDPFNSYATINFTTDSLGKINIKLDKAYSNNQISKINEVIENFIKNNIQPTLSDRQKIKLFHDFVIDNTVYDQDFKLDMDKNSYPYHPYNAYGPLIEGKGICSGYSDAMAIFLDKIGVKNYKVSNKEHIWNVVYLDSTWYHLDLTWDDPVTSNGQQVVLYDFYLITTNSLKQKQTTQHEYNIDLYKELK